VFDRALGAYLGLAMGDALGATVEFMRPREIKAQYGVHRDIIGGGWLKLPAGQVTDDTTMSLALGDALLRTGAGPLRELAPQGVGPAEESPEQAAARQLLGRAVGDAFVAWLRSKPVDCGNTCRRGILRYLHQGTLLGPLNEGDAGNGAVMRNLPVVLATLWDDERWAGLSLLQARLTHHHPLSDQATLALSTMVRRLILGGTALDAVNWVDEWVAQHPAFRYVPYPGRASAYVVDTVQTVLHHFAAEHDDMATALIATVNQGEDADTTGALVGMLAGATCGAQALPRAWLRRLNPAVVTAITEQTSALLALAAEAGAVPPPCPAVAGARPVAAPSATAPDASGAPGLPPPLAA
jgi:ADP-ribosyl-[dinitrogen reductase] hydrolase